MRVTKEDNHALAFYLISGILQYVYRKDPYGEFCNNSVKAGQYEFVRQYLGPFGKKLSKWVNGKFFKKFVDTNQTQNYHVLAYDLEECMGEVFCKFIDDRARLPEKDDFLELIKSTNLFVLKNDI